MSTLSSLDLKTNICRNILRIHKIIDRNIVNFTTMKWLSEYIYLLFRIFLPRRKIDCDGKLLKINFFNGVCQSDPKILCLVLLIFGKKFLTKLIKSKIFQSLPANYLQTLYSYLQKITAKFILPLRSLILRKFSTSCQISGCRFPWLDLTSSQLIWVPAKDSTRTETQSSYSE